MTTRVDIVGVRFGRLTVTSADCIKGGKWHWNCRCDCGRDTVAEGFALKNGNTRSCGCLRSETATRLATKHGLAKHPLYQMWKGMKARCYNHRHSTYGNYGGRGIGVCRRWRESFAAFLTDVGERPTPLHTLDRIDGNRGYCPSNCRWANRREQGRNRDTTTWLEYNGERMTQSEAAKKYVIGRYTITRRKRLGWTDDAILRNAKRRMVA